LFDLAQDPLGLVDVSQDHPETLASMREILDGYLADAAAIQRGTEQSLSEDTVRQLKALGYLQ
jgi:hypothetical protein